MLSNLMKMKKIVAIIALFFAGVVFVSAQEANQNKRVGKIMNRIEQACHPSNEQASKVLFFVQQFVKTARDNKQRYGNDKVSLKAANKVNKQNFKENLSQILTPEQMNQLAAYKSNERKQATQGADGNQ